jgi:hypothetical protein
MATRRTTSLEARAPASRQPRRVKGDMAMSMPSRGVWEGCRHRSPRLAGRRGQMNVVCTMRWRKGEEGQSWGCLCEDCGRKDMLDRLAEYTRFYTSITSEHICITGSPRCTVKTVYSDESLGAIAHIAEKSSCTKRQYFCVVTDLQSLCGTILLRQLGTNLMGGEVSANCLLYSWRAWNSRKAACNERDSRDSECSGDSYKAGIGGSGNCAGRLCAAETLRATLHEGSGPSTTSAKRPSGADCR